MNNKTANGKSSVEKISEKEAIKEAFCSHLKYSLATTQENATPLERFTSLAYAIRNFLLEKWTHTQKTYYENGTKQVNYLSMEYLIGRLLYQNVINLGLTEELKLAMEELGEDLGAIEEVELEAGLGNGGLGRLAACFMESMASLDIPGFGYGIRYEYGIFQQNIENGFQVEHADNWLRLGNPWEIPRPEITYPIKFYGRVESHTEPDGRIAFNWVDTHDDVLAMAYDTPVPGYQTHTVNNLRLWSARSTCDFDFDFFNSGDYIRAMTSKQESETISKVLYPNDNIAQGRELRLKQEYFFVSASLQDLLKRYKHFNRSFDEFSDFMAVQLNDTHPSLAVPELMRLLMDEEGLPWDKAWEITVSTMGYTNHTVLPEALEKWPVSLMEKILPRHLQIIYEINHRFLQKIRVEQNVDDAQTRALSLIEEGDVPQVRMAHVAIVGSHTINGVAQLHSKILREQIFNNFYKLFPERFINITNGISPRIWLKQCNPGLEALVSQYTGKAWGGNLDSLESLIDHIDDEAFCQRWRSVKRDNKLRLIEQVQKTLGVQLNPDSIFDVHIKRIHEYKRQLLNILHAIVLYTRIKKNPDGKRTPRSVIFAGKAAPGYFMAKRIIKLITSVAEKINNDAQIGDALKVVFLPNYSVSLAEKIIPAADLSQQISTAGMEASGTGNMKLALNGAVTLGTLDGANIEILEEVGAENIYIFGMTADEVKQFKTRRHQPAQAVDPELKVALDMIREGYFSKGDPNLFHPILDALFSPDDAYCILADFADYSRVQLEAENDFMDSALWTRKSILNSIHMGRFSSDRSIVEYSTRVWGVHPKNGSFPDTFDKHIERAPYACL
ncbi:MAG: glycogen/starch/alpha-glucan phosphorylase [Candidatus Nitrohelix vancouverensis]|uniref:Alpha-1,4 glucan phosphorylase n=1 Tax=Candidatus Nitrohelix vancouverensis TaxID=2705534 RepID=A0A7T0C591_9BACT|nr:MAG: glycogen/starch/alpha-glucan phosphorylase [Candidatus Nitrohelix vancouverensis]